jgi:electron transport complex protein RnfB
VESRILKRLFTPEGAEFALYLTLIPEESNVVALRAKISVQESFPAVGSHGPEKGSFTESGLKAVNPSNMACQYAIGIWELHVNDLDQGLARDRPG